MFGTSIRRKNVRPDSGTSAIKNRVKIKCFFSSNPQKTREKIADRTHRIAAAHVIYNSLINQWVLSARSSYKTSDSNRTLSDIPIPSVLSGCLRLSFVSARRFPSLSHSPPPLSPHCSPQAVAVRETLGLRSNIFFRPNVHCLGKVNVCFI